MPAENELKFILSFDACPKLFEQAGWKKVEIEQSYLPKGTRPTVEKKGKKHFLSYTFQDAVQDKATIVKFQIPEEDYNDYITESPDKAPRVRSYNKELQFNHKFWVASKGRDTESETVLNKKKYNALRDGAESRMTKDRYIFPEEVNGEKWEVDFIRDDDVEIYAIMAEVEMPEGRDTPTTMPKLLRPFIVHEVDKGDKSFSSRKFCDQGYAEQKLSEIGLIRQRTPTRAPALPLPEAA